MKYRIIVSGHANPEEAAKQLTELVKQAIASGWQPLGGVASAADSHSKLFTLSQAVVRP